MASKRIIEVRISGAIKSSEPKKTEPKNDVDDQDKSESSVDSIFKNQIFQAVKNELTEMAMYGINRHLTLTDDYIGERQLNAGLNVINRTVSSAALIGYGAKKYGAVGAIVGAVATSISLVFDIVKNYDQQNIHIKQMDVQLEFQRQRAGYSLTSGSIGENK